MRRFKLKESADNYDYFGAGMTYQADYIAGGNSVQSLVDEYPNDWEAISDTILHKDTDLGHYAGLAMGALLSNNNLASQITNQFGSVGADRANEITVTGAIKLAQELIKQLNKISDETI